MARNTVSCLKRVCLVALGATVGLACGGNSDTGGSGGAGGTVGMGGGDTMTGSSGGAGGATMTGSSGGAGGSGGDPTTGSGGGTSAGPTFAEVHDKVLVAEGCTNGYCHGGGSASLLLTDADTSYASLVGKPAGGSKCKVGGPERVVPGDPEGSLLWQKIAPDVAVCGVKMPIEEPALAPEKVELVRAWIAAGAMK